METEMEQQYTVRLYGIIYTNTKHTHTQTHTHPYVMALGAVGYIYMV
jgi:hypothetical protein